MSNRRRKYDIQRSSYTNRKIHKKLSGDTTIYEHDRLITYTGSQTSGSPTFPMLYTENRYGKQKHNNGEWESIDKNNGLETCITQSKLNELSTSPSENSVKIKPKYRSLLNFAYFGSCVDLVETSLDNIIFLFHDKTVDEIEKMKKDSNLSEFEEYMLNTNDTPKYTMVLDYYYENDLGVRSEVKKLTFPTKIVDGLEYLDLDTFYFEDYYKTLKTLAEFHDTKQTNNMWRMMTHDSIKKMDFTFVKNDDDIDDYADGTTKMNKIISAIGRQFDTLKLYIDNIKSVNNLSYDDFNSMPDYSLSDKLELMGWEVCSVAPDNNEKMSNDINIKFMRNLLMNSKSILTRKGTKHSIDMLLSLFGLSSYDMNKDKYDYKIDEQVYVARSFNDGGVEIGAFVESGRELNVEKYNSWKTEYSDNPEGETDLLQGLPISTVVFENSEGEKKYLIPWFDRMSKIDGEPYFEMSGGWFHLPKKSVVNRVVENTYSICTILDSEELPLYDESINRLNIMSDFSDLKVHASYNKWINVKNAVCYVTDIFNFENEYDFNVKYDGEYVSNWDDDKKIGYREGWKKPSHYFILKDVDNAHIIGNYAKTVLNENGEYVIDESEVITQGWVNIPEEDFIGDSLTDDAKWVLYIESIKDDHKGNKPHRGDKYDDGKSYKDLFERIFGYNIDTDVSYSRKFIDVAYNCEDDTLKEGIINCGFNLDTIIDNVKVHYFTDNKYGDISYEETGDLFYNSELTPHNFENNSLTWGDAADYSVINSKQMKITFTRNFIDGDDAYNYFIKCILPYLEQVIPSTTIVKVEYEIV